MNLFSNLRLHRGNEAATIEGEFMSEKCWNPIETAPQNGQTVLLGYFNKCDKWRTVRGQWYSQDQINDEWEEPEGVVPGWYETSENASEYDDVGCWPINPTWWRPLPEPAI